GCSFLRAEDGRRGFHVTGVQTCALPIYGQSLTPGNEQIGYWHSSRADIEGGRNFASVKHPAVDAMVEKILTADTREALQAATKEIGRASCRGGGELYGGQG